MRLPEFCIRTEIIDDGSPTHRTWHVVLGGAQRGGLSVSHGYMPISGELLSEHIECILAKTREMLEAYACTLDATQIRLF
jgi:hypothetical protein